MRIVRLDIRADASSYIPSKATLDGITADVERLVEAMLAAKGFFDVEVVVAVEEGQR